MFAGRRGDRKKTHPSHRGRHPRLGQRLSFCPSLKAWTEGRTLGPPCTLFTCPILSASLWNAGMPSAHLPWGLRQDTLHLVGSETHSARPPGRASQSQPVTAAPPPPPSTGTLGASLTICLGCQSSAGWTCCRALGQGQAPTAFQPRVLCTEPWAGKQSVPVPGPVPYSKSTLLSFGIPDKWSSWLPVSLCWAGEEEQL